MLLANYFIASIILSTCSFSRIFWRWRFTVCMLMFSFSEISLLNIPCLARASISLSRRVSRVSVALSIAKGTISQAISAIPAMVPAEWVFLSLPPAYLAPIACLHGRWLARCGFASAYQEKLALVWGSNSYLPCGDRSYLAYRGTLRVAKSRNPLDGLPRWVWYLCISRICKEFL